MHVMDSLNLVFLYIYLLLNNMGFKTSQEPRELNFLPTCVLLP